MDIDGTKLSSLQQSQTPTPKDGNQKAAPTRKRFRRSKSAPGYVPRPDMIGDPAASLASSKSKYWKPHPSLRNVGILLSLYLGIGTLCFYLVRSQIKGKKTNGVLDAVYFCIVTMTTVGYGDLVPATVLAKLLSCAFVFSGMALVALILSKAADYLVEKQESLLMKALNKNKVGTTDMQNKVERNLVKHKSYVAVTILCVLVSAGTMFLALVEELSFVDAFYCVCSTITTLGYGDKSFSTAGGRIFAVFWILTSTLCLGQIYFYIAEYNTEKRQKELVKWVLTRRMTDIDLEAADIDDDGEVGAADFVIYKMKEMGKISEEDVVLVMKEFDEIDVDQSGTISAADLRLSQLQTDKCLDH